MEISKGWLWCLLCFCCLTLQQKTIAATYLIDFGLPTNQTTTDLNGNHWNNLTAYGNDTPVNVRSGSMVLLDTTGAAGFTMNYTFPNVSRNFDDMYGFSQTTGSLSNLGLMDIGSGKNDGIWSNGPVSLMFEGLDPTMFYTFSIYAHRVNDPARTANYQLFGLVNSPVINRNVATTSQNNGELVVFSDFQPDANGRIELILTQGNSNYTYINSLQITAVPEPMKGILFLLGTSGLLLRRRK